jgi:micrococcal nuclease
LHFSILSRRRRKAISVLSLLVVVFLAWADKNFSYHIESFFPAHSTGQTNTGDIEKYHAGSFKVVNVVDGDTIDIDIPDGRDNRTRIRLWGVDTPETKNEKTGVMYFGPQAEEFTRKSAFGKQVRIFLNQQKNTRDKYNRLLAYVQLPDGSYLNENLLSEGFAYADLRFQHDLYNKYKQLESLARSSKKGLWRNVTYEQMPQWRQEQLTDN